MSLLKISYWVEKWKNFENRLIFGEVMGKSLVSCFFFDSRCIWMLCKICKVNGSVTCLSQKYFLPKVIVQTHTDLHNRSTAVPWRQNGRHQVYSRQNWPLSNEQLLPVDDRIIEVRGESSFHTTRQNENTPRYGTSSLKWLPTVILFIFGGDLVVSCLIDKPPDGLSHRVVLGPAFIQWQISAVFIVER